MFGDGVGFEQVCDVTVFSTVRDRLLRKGGTLLYWSLEWACTSQIDTREQAPGVCSEGTSCAGSGQAWLKLMGKRAPIRYIDDADEDNRGVMNRRPRRGEVGRLVWCYTGAPSHNHFISSSSSASASVSSTTRLPESEFARVTSWNRPKGWKTPS